MKCIIFVAICAFMGVVSCRPEEKYTTKFDNVNIQDILKSDRLLTKYFNCLMKETGCTPDGRELLAVLPDALKTECSKCSDKQKEATKTIINYLIENKKDMWNQLEAKFDPQRTYIKKYQKHLKN